MNNKLHYRFRRLLVEADGEFDINKCAALVKNEGTQAPFQIVIYDPKKFLGVLKNHNHNQYMSLKSLLVKDGALIATIKLMPKDEDDKEPCMGAAEVIQSAVGEFYQGRGVGKLLYRLAIAGLKQPIMADRGSVSQKAQRVWKSMEKDPSFEKLPPDKPPYIGTFDGYDSTPPEDDDCEINHDGSGQGDALNKAYASKDTSKEQQMLKVLVVNHEAFTDKLRDIQDEIYGASMVTELFLLDCARLLFQDVYNDNAD